MSLIECLEGLCFGGSGRHACPAAAVSGPCLCDREYHALPGV